MMKLDGLYMTGAYKTKQNTNSFLENKHINSIDFNTVFIFSKPCIFPVKNHSCPGTIIGVIVIYI